jgi:hypothetical protein
MWRRQWEEYALASGRRAAPSPGDSIPHLCNRDDCRLEVSPEETGLRQPDPRPFPRPVEFDHHAEFLPSVVERLDCQQKYRLPAVSVGVARIDLDRPLGLGFGDSSSFRAKNAGEFA